MAEWLAAVSLGLAIAVSGRRPAAARMAGLRAGSAVQGSGGGHSALAVGVVIGTGLAAIGVSWSLLGVLAITGALVRRLQRRRCAARSRAAVTAATVEVTVALAGELRAGRTPSQALIAVVPVAGPLSTCFALAAESAAIGASAADELARGARLPGAERLRYVAAAWRVADTAGGRIAVVLERLSEAMDSDDELRRELDAAMAGPHATMALLSALPLLGIALGQAIGAEPLVLLVHRPIGWALLAAAGLLDCVGVLVTRAIASAALRG
jgi:tight adherence protein B